MESSLAFEPLISEEEVEDLVEAGSATTALFSSPFAPLEVVHFEVLRNTTAAEWNDAVEAAREESPEWVPALRNKYMYEMDLSGRDLSGADLSGADLSWVNMRSAALVNADMTGATLNRADLSYADVTGANYKDARGWDTVRHTGTQGFVPPLQDVTEQVAMRYFIEATQDPKSLINEGVDALREGGMQSTWHGSTLKFWMSSEVAAQRSACHDGECCCETEHSCNGDCDCCACYRGECDCEPEHDYEDCYESGDTHIASVIGSVKFEWTGSGIIGDIRIDRQSLHPHVSTDGTACWGNATVPRSLRASDYLMMVMGWIGQHNPASEYRPISDLPQIH